MKLTLLPSDKKFLEKNDFHNLIKITELVIDKNYEMYILEYLDKFLIIKRTGKCDYKKCKNACCMFCQSSSWIKDYSKGFFDSKNEFGDYILNRPCNNLQKDGSCKLWGKRSFPRACRQFPHVSDSVYWEVADVCTIKYKILYTINRTNTEKYRQEMLKCFLEQK